MSLLRISPWIHAQILALAAIACQSARPAPATYPPPPQPPLAQPPAVGSGAQPSEPRVCDGQWHTEQRGDFEYDCRCRVLGAEAKSVDGLGRADIVKRMHAVSPLTVAVNSGLYEALGLAAPRCDEATVSWQFVATEPAKATQCRLRGTSDPMQGEDVSVRGKLQLELAQGHRERLVGRGTLFAQRSGLGLPRSFVSTAGAFASTAEPRLSFSAERGGRLGLEIAQEGGRSEALAHLPGSPATTALFRPRAPGLGSFEKLFGVSLRGWLQRMTVVSESCVIDKGPTPPLHPDAGAVSGQQTATTQPVTVNAKVLGAELFELTERPCSLEAARVTLQLTGFPGLAPTSVSGVISLVDDQRLVAWPTKPRPVATGPAVLVGLGGAGTNRIDVPAPKWLVDAAPCAAKQRGSLEVQIAAVPGQTGPETSIAADWASSIALSHRITPPRSPNRLRCGPPRNRPILPQPATVRVPCACLYENAIGRRGLAIGKPREGIESLRRAVTLLEEGGASVERRGSTMDMFARGLRDTGCWAEAERVFREALRLAEEGGATAVGRGITLHELACGLRGNGRWGEAEPAFREALRLKEEGGDTPVSRGVTLDHLACGLRDSGRWREAEPLFREALRHKADEGAPAESNGATMRELAQGLRERGNVDEFDSLLAEAAQLLGPDGPVTAT